MKESSPYATQMNHPNVISHGCHANRLRPALCPTLIHSATAVPAQSSGEIMRITWYTLVAHGLSKSWEKDMVGRARIGGVR